MFTDEVSQKRSLPDIKEGKMVKKLYEVRNRSGDLILENVTSGEIKEELHCTTAQINNANYESQRHSMREIVLLRNA